MSDDVLLEVRALKRYFPIRGGLLQRQVATVQAVDDVSFAVRRGETLGIVGESGCGKSTLGRMIAQVMPATGGSIRFRGRDVAGMSRGERLKTDLSIQMVFQDTMSSLHLRKTAGDIVTEAPVHHGMIARRERRDLAAAMLEKVGLSGDAADRYPRQFSGGQRQRIGIARALAVEPDVLVCDESVASLDVSIQAQILNLFMELRRTLGLTYIFVSHDLGVVRHISDTVAVMYLGRIVETARSADLFAAPLHPYTQALLEEVPRISRGSRTFHAIRGEIPSPLNPPPGCHFHPRCPRGRCPGRVERPVLRRLDDSREVACHPA